MSPGLFAQILMVAVLAGCSSTPLPVYYTLDDGHATASPRSLKPSVAIIQIGVPALIDRPQIVVRTGQNRVRMSETQRWAAPLKQEIPRVLAKDLGLLLDSSQIIAMPINAQSFDPDFRLSLEVQRFEATEKQGVELDLVWRIEARSGQMMVGRSSLHEVVARDDYADLVSAQRRALSRSAIEIADRIRQFGSIAQ